MQKEKNTDFEFCYINDEYDLFEENNNTACKAMCLDVDVFRELLEVYPNTEEVLQQDAEERHKRIISLRS